MKSGHAADACPVKICRADGYHHPVSGADDICQMRFLFLQEGNGFLTVGQGGVVRRGGKTLTDGADGVDEL